MPTRAGATEYWMALAMRLCTAVTSIASSPQTRVRRSPPLTSWMRWASAVHAVLIDRGGDHAVDVDLLRVGEGVGGLQARELDDLLRHAGETLRLLAEPLREAAHLGRVVGRVLERLGEQPDGADRRLQLVADVGDEVAAHRVEAHRLRAVLGEQQHEARAEAGDAHA